MPCNNCNNRRCSGCEVEIHICNQCPPAQPCDCPILGLSTDCSTYDQDPIECNDVEVVAKNTILSTALNNIVSWACTRFAELQNYLRIINVGDGVDIYKGDNLIGEKELKSLTKTGDLLIITPAVNGNEIDFTIDEDELINIIGEQLPPDVCIESESLAITELDGCFQAELEVVSDTLTVTQESPGVIRVEQPTTTVIPALYVNNLYVPTYEEWVSAGGDLITNPSFEYFGTGSLARPITDSIRYTSTVASTITPNTAIQNALDTYVGDTGTYSRLNPEKLGQRIIVQDNRPNPTYTFPGNLNYTGLDIKIERDIFSTTTGFLLDMDDLTAFDDESAFVNIEIEKDIFLQIQGDGLNNTGNIASSSTYNTGKIIVLKGEGTLFSSINDINKYLINSDPLGASNSGLGSNNDGSLTFKIECNLRADLQGVWNIGGLSKIDIFGKVVSGQLTNNVDLSLKAFHQTGGQVRCFQGAILSINGGTRTSIITFNPLSIFTPVFIAQSIVLGGTATNLFEKTNSNTSILEVTNIIASYGLAINEVFESPNLWYVLFNNNILASGNIDVAKADLTGLNSRSAHNLIANRVIESLVKYGSRTAAESVLPIGSKFINTNSGNVDTDTWFIDITMQ